MVLWGVPGDENVFLLWLCYTLEFLVFFFQPELEALDFSGFAVQLLLGLSALFFSQFCFGYWADTQGTFPIFDHDGISDGRKKDHSQGADAPFRGMPAAEGVCVYQ